ncbi:hypothetical protein PMAYCL1PPCAC_23226, partial [Pristionchus mayeri]
FSRGCSVCFSSSPPNRLFFFLCRHIICFNCDEQLESKMGEKWKTCGCPFCELESESVMLCGESASIPRPRLPRPKLPRNEQRRTRKSDQRKGLVRSFISGNIDEETYRREYERAMVSLLRVESSYRGNKDVYAEEYTRINSILPQGASARHLAASAADAARREEKMTLIHDLREENEQNLFPRQCLHCWSLSPLHRSLFIRCGHVICRVCAEEEEMEAEEGLPQCPLCLEESSTVQLFEN